MKVLILPLLVVYMLFVGFTASEFGVGNAVFQSDSCLQDAQNCSVVIDPGDGFFGAILGFFKTLFNFYTIFFQILLFRLDINIYANFFIVGFITMTAFTAVYVLLRQG